MKKEHNGLIYTILVIWCIFALFPIYWALITSFKTDTATLETATYLPWVDFDPILGPWKTLFTKMGDQISRSFINSLVIATISSFLAVFVGALAAYGLDRFSYKLGFLKNQDILLWILSQRMLPPAVVILPYFLIFATTGLLDTHAGMILIYAVFNLPLAVWLIKNFVSQVPVSIEEAALVDGASRASIFFKIVLPLMAPGLVATYLFCLILAWNEFLFALVLTFEKAQTMPIMLAGQQSTVGTNWWIISAMVIVTIAPITIISLFLLKYMVKGLVLGAAKY